MLLSNTLLCYVYYVAPTLALELDWTGDMCSVGPVMWSKGGTPLLADSAGPCLARVRKHGVRPAWTGYEKQVQQYWHDTILLCSVGNKSDDNGDK